MRRICRHEPNHYVIPMRGRGKAVAWEILVASIGSAKVGGTGGSRVPSPGEGDLARCQEDELWPL